MDNEISSEMSDVYYQVCNTIKGKPNIMMSLFIIVISCIYKWREWFSLTVNRQDTITAAKIKFLPWKYKARIKYVLIIREKATVINFFSQ